MCRSEPWSSSGRAGWAGGRQLRCLRPSRGCRSRPRAGEVFGGSREVGAGWAVKSGVPSCSSGSTRGSWGPAQGEREGNHGGLRGARARGCQALQATGCPRARVIAKSRTAVLAVRLMVEEISVTGEELKSPHTRPAHGCIWPGTPMSTSKCTELAPRSPSCSTAGTVRCRKRSLLHVMPRWWAATLCNPPPASACAELMGR